MKDEFKIEKNKSFLARNREYLIYIKPYYFIHKGKKIKLREIGTLTFTRTTAIYYQTSGVGLSTSTLKELYEFITKLERKKLKNLNG